MTRCAHTDIDPFINCFVVEFELFETKQTETLQTAHVCRDARLLAAAVGWLRLLVWGLQTLVLFQRLVLPFSPRRSTCSSKYAQVCLQTLHRLLHPAVSQKLQL